MSSKISHIKAAIKDRLKLKSSSMSWRGMSIVVSAIDRKEVIPQTWKLFGSFPGDIGDTIEGDVLITYSPIYGYSMKARSLTISSSLLEDDNGLMEFLRKDIKGIGKVTADRLFAAFSREELIEALNTYSPKLHAVKGVSESKALIICNDWKAKKNIREVKPFLYSLGLGPAQTQHVIDMYGEDSMRVIKNNPYLMLNVSIPFKIVDRIAMSNGISNVSGLRVRAGLMYMLGNEHSGDTYINESVLKSRAELLLDLGHMQDDSNWIKAYESALIALENDKEIVIDAGKVFTAKLYKTEQYVGKRMATMVHSARSYSMIDKREVDTFLESYQKAKGIEFTTGQKSAIYRATSENVIIITGGPGTGKTSTIGALIELFQSKMFIVKIASPTGRSARRITESSGFEAETVHRMLQPIPMKGGGIMFYYNAENPLDADVLILDEVSMIDIRLMSEILRALKDGTKLIMVGDKDQLPSVGPGNVLNDCITSGKVPSVHLLTIFRQVESSKIISNSVKINSGHTDIDEGTSGSDFYWTQLTDYDSLGALVTDRIPNTFGIKSSDIKVITPFRREFVSVNVRSINKFLQNLCNSLDGPVREDGTRAEITYSDRTFRLNDPVMQLENNYTKMVFNGDIGIITNLMQDDDGHVSVVVDYQDDRSKQLYVESEIMQLDLAYGFTIHKSQGSEFDAVIVILPDEVDKAGNMLKRNLLYTAVTRAKQLCVVMSSKKSLQKAIMDNSYIQRRTMLTEWLMKFDIMERKSRKKRK